MKQRTVFDINGKTYMSPAAAADKWPISRQKIVAECKAGKVVGACLDSSNKWIIPIDARQPIDDENIRKILISLLCLKNKPSTGSINVEAVKVNEVIDYLKETGYLEKTDACNLNDLVLTEKGMHVATEGSKLNLDWLNAGITLVQVVGSIASMWSLVR